MESTGYHYIVIRDGVPRIKKSGLKVVQIAEDLVKAGWDGQEIHENYPWISLPQIYSALAYYFEHKDEMDAEIERRERFDAEMRAKYEDPAFLARAREMRKQLDEAKAAQAVGRRKGARTASGAKR
jgi:uncharacterized protein (DUF433 family)